MVETKPGGFLYSFTQRHLFLLDEMALVRHIISLIAKLSSRADSGIARSPATLFPPSGKNLWK